MELAEFDQGSNAKNVLKKVHTKVVQIEKGLGDNVGKSKVSPEYDAFYELAKAGKIIEPPFDKLALSMLEEISTELRSCYDAMIVNLSGFGYRFPCRVKKTETGEYPEELKSEIKKEEIFLKNFFAYCTDESFVEFRQKQDYDLESTGECYMEIIRSPKGEIQGFTHIPSYQMAITKQEEQPILYSRKILVSNEDDSISIKKKLEWKRFRKYVQCRVTRLNGISIENASIKKRWFKEFGDPRTYDNETGEIVPEKDVDKFPEEKKANEIFRRYLYSPRTAYGLPRYIGNLLSIYGDRKAEEINFTTFRNQNVPSMVIAVSNGALTEGSLERVKEFVESQIQESDNYSKFLIIETEMSEEGDDPLHSKIDIKPLTDAQTTDALFQNYSKNNRDKIRRVWRLPPIYVGKADDYTRATAESSRQLGDEQIFNPEREKFDFFVNRILLPVMGVTYHVFRTNTPNTTDNAQIVKILAGAEKTGGMTPRIARIMLEDILSIELPDFPKDFQADLPFSLIMAEAVKNKADTSEPGQTVTALKSVFGDVEDEEDEKIFEATCTKCGNQELVANVEEGQNEVVDYLLKLNRQLEKKWRQNVSSDQSDEFNVF